MENKQRQQLKRYADLVLSRWKLLITCLLLAVAIGLVYYLRLPKIYQAVSMLSYEQQQINPARMAPERQNEQLLDTVSTLSQLVTSRNSLEKIIIQYGLYEEVRQNLPIEDVIEIMRKQIKITPANRGDTFSVSFEGNNPEQVMKTTNALAALFIEENLKYREERATETSKYTQDELTMAKAVMDEKEKSMRDYKLKYYNEMPEQRESNLARLNALNEQHQGIQDSIQDLERTRVLAQEQIVLRQRLASSLGASDQPGASSSSTGRETVSDSERLEQLRRYLASMQGKYTEKHPEVTRTKQLIAQLEARIGSSPDSGGPGASLPRRTTQSRSDSLEIGQARLQLKDVDLNIKKLRAEQAAIPAEIEKYQQWIAAAPIREAEWNTLTRDFNELKRHYDYLVSQNLQAQSAENIERKQKGSKFKIIDPARLPDKPVKPNFLRMLFVAVAGGLALGIGITLTLDFMDTSFKDAVEVEEFLGLPVVSSIAYIENNGEVAREQFRFKAFVILYTVSGLLLVATILYLWTEGLIIIGQSAK